MSTKIYTKTGDDGTTALFGGTRVSKDHLRIDAYGTVDELNAVLGMTLSHTPPLPLDEDLYNLSTMLFTVGADLATPLIPPPTYAIPRVEVQHIQWLEDRIDKYEQELEPLKNFILPSGTRVASLLHFARTVCRRAERCAVTLAHNEDIGEHVTKFLNRCSDYLFVAARLANARAGVQDIVWRNPSL
jgi:cob(I)alamin adenosyltransferase